MNLTDDEQKLQDEACDYIKQNKDALIERFILSKRPLPLDFATIFMAGSPGAGKTEFSRRYMPLALDKNDERIQGRLKEMGLDINGYESLLVVIDVDEIREFLPQYCKTDVSSGRKGNAHVIQKAAGRGLDVLRKYCFDNRISFIHDGTFGNYETMRILVDESLKTGRDVQIFYIYIDPLSAWEFTKAREYLEGRNIMKERFIEQFFRARENVERIKRELGDKVTLHLILKDSQNQVVDVLFNAPSIDTYLRTQYNKGVIREYSHDDLLSLIS